MARDKNNHMNFTETDLLSTGRGFESRTQRCRVQPWASCLDVCASDTNQYNSVPVNLRDAGEDW